MQEYDWVKKLLHYSEPHQNNSEWYSIESPPQSLIRYILALKEKL